MKKIKHVLAILITVTMVVTGGSLDGFAAFSYAAEGQDVTAAGQEQDVSEGVTAGPESAAPEAEAPGEDAGAEAKDAVKDEPAESGSSDAKTESKPEGEAAKADKDSGMRELKAAVRLSDDSRWSVTAAYGGEAGIPDGAKLSIEEIDKKDLDGYFKHAHKALRWAENVPAVYAGFLDISIICKGRKVQPKAEVELTIASEDIRDNIETVRVVRFEFDETKSEKAADLRKGTALECGVMDDDALRFETDALSVFGFIAPGDSALKNQTLKAGKVTLKGMMPEDAAATAKDASNAKAVKKLSGKDDTILSAYDITIRADDAEYQPDAEHPIQVRIANKAIKEDSDLTIWHIRDDGTKEQVEDFITGDGSVSFEADGFSVYVVIDHEGETVVTPRVEFHFISPDYAESVNGSAISYSSPAYEFTNKHNDDQTSQILKDGESLELIKDPANKENDKYFFGWYAVDPFTTSGTNDYGLDSEEKFHYTWPASPDRIRFEQGISIAESDVEIGSEVHWSLGSASGTGTVDADGNVHVLLAPMYENYHFVNFKQYARGSGAGSSDSNIMARKLVALGGASSVDVKISDIRATSTDAVRLIFKGWEYNAGTDANPNWVSLDTVDYTGSEISKAISVSGDIDLYPIFIEARWTDFNVGPTGNGATYVPSRFLLAWDDDAGMIEEEGQNVITKLDAPVRKGYTFGGWYANVTDYSSETGDFNTGDRITETAVTGGNVNILSDTTITGTEGGNLAWKVDGGKLKFYKGLSRLILYAKWIPDASNITIVYWTENAEDDDYFSRAVKTVTTAELNAQLHTNFSSGSTITLQDLQRYQDSGVGILATDYLDDVGAVPAGEQIFYDLKTQPAGSGDQNFEASKVISGEGTTLFNVYYSRKVFTLVFHIGRDKYISTSGEQTSPNNGSWLQMFYNDSTATSYDAAEGGIPTGSRGVSRLSPTVTMSYGEETYTVDYETNTQNVKNDYVPADGENVYTIKAKYGAYIGDRWPTSTNPNFTFTSNDNQKELYTWSSYYDSRFTQLANDRRGSGQNWHPDINGVYSYMSAELCSNRDGTAIINDNQVHHLVAYFGDRNKAGVRKHYHILYEAIDGTYDPAEVEIVSGSDYSEYNMTTWATNVAHASQGLINGRSFYEVSSSDVISNLPPESQLASEIEGFEQIYSCYNTPSANNHDIYFFYTPKKYTLTFKFEDEADRKVDHYYYTESLAGAKKYDDPEKTGYSFRGWYTNEAGAGEPFDFAGSKMPAMNLVLYPVMDPLQYMIKIDPNGGVIDHINYDRPGEDAYGICANNYGVTGSGHNRSQATYFTAGYDTPISPYTVTRNYVHLSDKEKTPGSASYYSGDKYYYINMQFHADYDGAWGLSPDLRNAVYMTADQLEKYYDYYVAVVEANEDYYSGVTKLNFDDFCAAYTEYDPRDPDKHACRPVSSEHYTFMGWYQVYEDGTEASMPYNFNDPVYGEITLRAKWRLDGGIYIKYNPYYFAEEEGNVTAVIGDLQEWTDPANIASQLYADQSSTNVLRAPTNVTQGWVFRGWRVVEPDGVSSTYNDGNNTFTYQKWKPIQLDDGGNPVYYDPGDDFTVDSELISDSDSHGSIIHMQAYYEPVESSYRRPDVTNLILDANDAYGGFVNTTDSTALPVLAGPGSTSINTAETELDTENRPTQILFGDIQSNLALHLYRYATTDTHDNVQGTNFFTNKDGHLLIGFDENEDPEQPTTGNAYIPAFAADAVAAVTRNDNRTLYAMWEPMVYATFVNTTDEPITVVLSGTGASTVSIVNKVTGAFDRESAENNTITIPAKSGDVNGEVKVVFPGAVAGTDELIATATNDHLRKKLIVGGQYRDTVPYGQGTQAHGYASGVPYGVDAVYDDAVLRTDPNGIIVTYSEIPDQKVIFDVNGGAWTETSADYQHASGDLYSIDADRIVNNQYHPADPTHTGKVFVGWTTNADIAAQTDFSSTSAVTWGNTTITPDAGSNVLDKVKSNYLWDFSNNPPYDQTLYAVWSDAVTVTFDLQRTGNYLHNWTRPATTNVNGSHVFYRSSDSSHYVVYTLAKGEKVPRPDDPTVDSTWNRPDYIFLEWLTDNSKINMNTNPAAISALLFDFTEPVLESATVYTSWMSTQYVRKYTYTIKNEIEGGPAGEEFEYKITAASNMNSSGTYYTSDPSFLPVTTNLKNNETYTVEVTAVRYNASGWNHNSLYVVITDRDGAVVGSGHLLEYHKNATTIENESSAYQVTVTVTQTQKANYQTTVTANDGTTVDLGAQSYTFTNGKNNNTTSRTVTTDTDSFTFRSSSGDTAFVGTNKNNLIGTDYRDVAETIIFHNKTDEQPLPAPTGFTNYLLPLLWMLLLGMFLWAAMTYTRRERSLDGFAMAAAGVGADDSSDASGDSDADADIAESEISETGYEAFDWTRIVI